MRKQSNTRQLLSRWNAFVWKHKFVSFMITYGVVYVAVWPFFGKEGLKTAKERAEKAEKETRAKFPWLFDN